MRIRGRPKQIPNLIVMSPIRVPPVLNNDALENDLGDLDDLPSPSKTVPPVMKISRERKVQEPEVQNDTPAYDENCVGALLSKSLSGLKPGLGVSKHSKKRSIAPGTKNQVSKPAQPSVL